MIPEIFALVLWPFVIGRILCLTYQKHLRWWWNKTGEQAVFKACKMCYLQRHSSSKLWMQVSWVCAIPVDPLTLVSSGNKNWNRKWLTSLHLLPLAKGDHPRSTSAPLPHKITRTSRQETSTSEYLSVFSVGGVVSTYLFLVYGGCHVIGLNPMGFIAFSEFCLNLFCFFFCLDPFFFFSFFFFFFALSV